MEKHLKDLGFNEKEVAVYGELLRSGKCGASEMSKKCNLPRSSTYDVLELLAEKGVVSKERHRGTTFFFANDPDSFDRYLERQQKELEQQKVVAKKLKELITPELKVAHHRIPQLLFFEGRLKIEGMLYDYLPKWRESYERLGDFTMWGYQDHGVVEHYQRWHDHAWESRNPDEKICLFSNTKGGSYQEKARIQNRQIRSLPFNLEFSNSLWIHGEFVLMIITSENPHYAYQLFDPIISRNLRMLFQLLWRLTQSPE